MRFLILLVSLFSVVAGAAPSAFDQTPSTQTASVRLGVRQNYDSIWITLKETGRGQIYDFCQRYTHGGALAPLSGDNDLSLSCEMHDLGSILKVGIGFTNNVVHNVGEPIQLVEPIYKIHGLTSTDPVQLVVTDQYGNHFSLKINSFEIAVGFSHN